MTCDVYTRNDATCFFSLSLSLSLVSPTPFHYRFVLWSVRRACHILFMVCDVVNSVTDPRARFTAMPKGVSKTIDLKIFTIFNKTQYCWEHLHTLINVSLNGINPLKPELNSICYLLALLGAHHFLHVSRIRVKLLTFRLLMSYIYIWSTHSWCF